jgi:hypothetical protein
MTLQLLHISVQQGDLKFDYETELINEITLFHAMQEHLQRGFK